MARPSNTDQRRAEIVKALGQVMASRGYEGATVLEIARKAGLTPGLVHYHFAGKHEILLELCEGIARLIEQRYRDRITKVDNPAQQLEAFIDAHVALDSSSDAGAVAAWSAVGAEAQRDERVREVYTEHVQRDLAELRRLFTAALRHEDRRVHDIAGKAAIVLAAMEGAFRLGTSAPTVIPKGFASRGINQLAAALVSAEPTRNTL